MKSKKVFLVVTEKGRERGKISFCISEITDKKEYRIVANEHTCSANSHRGLDTEAVQALVNVGELPITAIKANHYRNTSIKNYSLIMVEGSGLNYVYQIN